MDFIFKIFEIIIIEISPYLLFGFLFYRILSVSLSVETVTKYLFNKKLKSIFLIKGWIYHYLYVTVVVPTKS